MLAVNVQGTLYVTHAALPHLVRAAEDSQRRVADLVFISSTAGRVARPGGNVYSLTKFGVGAFAESLRQELIKQRVRVSVVEPGRSTPSSSRIYARRSVAAQSQVGSIEAMRPEDIADAISYIVTRDRRVAINEMLVRAGEQAGREPLARGLEDGANASCELPAPAGTLLWTIQAQRNGAARP